MNPFEFYRAFAKLTPDKLRELGVQAVQQAEDEVVLDSILHNHPNYLTNRDIPSAGKTFDDKEIIGTQNYSDWDHSFEFHDNLKFLENGSIEFTSKGKGYDSIRENFEEIDYIAPQAKILSKKTMDSIKFSFILRIKNELLIIK